MHTLMDKVVIITGGANGIGASIVKECLQEGVKFIGIVDIDEVSGEGLEKEVIEKYGKDKVHFYKCDVTMDDKLHEIFDEILKNFGVIDVLINNAAVLSETLTTFKREIAINFTATVSTTLKALELMRSDQGGNGGTIINVSSLSALNLWSPSMFIYAATKCGILHFTACIGKEEYYRHTNVRALTVCFGLTSTKIFSKAESFDNVVNQKILESTANPSTLNLFYQTPEVAARGLIQSYKTGNTGSTWLIDNSKVCEITQNIEEAFNIMSKTK